MLWEVLINANFTISYRILSKVDIVCRPSLKGCASHKIDFRWEFVYGFRKIAINQYLLCGRLEFLKRICSVSWKLLVIYLLQWFLWSLFSVRGKPFGEERGKKQISSTLRGIWRIIFLPCMKILSLFVTNTMLISNSTSSNPKSVLLGRCWLMAVLEISSTNSQ